MTELMQFLTSNPAGEEGVKIDLGGRLEGRPFTIRSLTAAEWDDVQTQCLKTVRGKTAMDSAKFNEMAVLAGCQEPDFALVAFIEANDCKTPEQLLRKVLLPGEIADIAKAISDVSGFGTSYTRMVDEAKNS